MPKFLKISYWSTKENKTKYLQTTIANHESLEKAREYLETKKKLKLRDDPMIEGPQPREGANPFENETKDPSEGYNLIEQAVQSTPELDQIMSTIQYSPFKLDIDPETGFSMTIFGASKSYKTYLMKRIIKKYFNSECVVLLCAQNIHAKIYDDLPPHVIKLDHYSKKLIASMAKINKKCDNQYRFMVILDDIITVKADKKLEELYLTLRNSRISIINCLQNIQLLKKTSRGNSNIVIFRKFNQEGAIVDYAMKEYLANFPPFKDLKMPNKTTLYRLFTNQHDYFVLDVLNNTLIVCKEEDIDK